MFTIINSGLFYKKLATLFIATITLVPLIHYKLYVPAFAYLVGLLLLHALILYMYFMGVPWRQFLKNKKEFVIRISGIGLFIYLLTVVSFVGSTTMIILNLVGAFVIHVCILLFMMVSRTQAEET